VQCIYRVLNNTFSTTYNLMVLQCVHTVERTYRCDGCNETFSKAYILKEHKGVHTGEHPYCCDVLIKHSRLFKIRLFEIFIVVTFVELLTV